MSQKIFRGLGPRLSVTHDVYSYAARRVIERLVEENRRERRGRPPTPFVAAIEAYLKAHKRLRSWKRENY